METPNPREARQDSLLDTIKSYIRHNGPIGVDAYWDLCLSHPVHGYYMTQDPFGQKGDFITAPEISQMFGEMIGVWCADQWLKMGSPSMLHLIECGPGRGTLMADALRATRQIAGFQPALQIHLVETSPCLRQRQADSLAGITPTWHDNLSTLPDTEPVIVIGNEFLDALPIRQIEKVSDGWRERQIGLSASGELAFGLGPVSAWDHPGQLGEVFEISPVRERVMDDICGAVARQGGAVLMIDYGHLVSANGDTFQAMREHRFVSVLDDPGQADLTSHVDFESMAQIASARGLTVHLQTQGEFLRQMGIELRAAALMKMATPAQREGLSSGLDRLVSPAQMGTLFKVIEVNHG